MKYPNYFGHFLKRGQDQIRTDIAWFAIMCLAIRPLDL